MFNVRVMGPQMMKMGWWQLKHGLRFLFAGLSLPIRGLFHTRELLRAAEEEVRVREEFIHKMNQVMQEEAKALEAGNPNAN
jgi:hypothetical protein